MEDDSLWIVEPIPSTEDSTVQRSLWIGKVLTVITVQVSSIFPFGFTKPNNLELLIDNHIINFRRDVFTSLVQSQIDKGGYFSCGPRVAQNFPKSKHPHESHICCYASYEDSKNTNVRSVAYA